MAYIKNYEQFELIDLEGSLDATTSLDNNANLLGTTRSVVHKNTQNGFVIVSTEDHSESPNNHAIKIIQDSIFSFFDKKTHKTPLNAIKQAIIFANKALFFYASHNQMLKGKRLSCLVVLIREKQILYGYVGKNNLFIQKKENLKRVTAGLAQTEESDLHETIYINSSVFEPNMKIRVCDRPVLPATNDLLLVCSSSFVSITDDVVLDLFNNETNLQNIGIKLAGIASSYYKKQNATFNIVRFKLKGGTYTIAGTLEYLYGNLISKIVAIITSTPVLIVLAALVVIIMFLYVI